MPNLKDERSVTLHNGGALSISMSVDLLNLRGAERALMVSILDLLDTYERKKIESTLGALSDYVVSNEE